jgi:hypothetical protein
MLTDCSLDPGSSSEIRMLGRYCGFQSRMTIRLAPPFLDFSLGAAEARARPSHIGYHAVDSLRRIAGGRLSCAPAGSFVRLPLLIRTAFLGSHRDRCRHATLRNNRDESAW